VALLAGRPATTWLSGTNWRFTMTKLMNIGYDLDEASTIFAAAVAAYCPWEDSQSLTTATDPSDSKPQETEGHS
jgi:hypothetical protein